MIYNLNKYLNMCINLSQLCSLNLRTGQRINRLMVYPYKIYNQLKKYNPKLINNSIVNMAIRIYSKFKYSDFINNHTNLRHDINSIRKEITIFVLNQVKLYINKN